MGRPRDPNSKIAKRLKPEALDRRRKDIAERTLKRYYNLTPEEKLLWNKRERDNRRDRWERMSEDEREACRQRRKVYRATQDKRCRKLYPNNNSYHQNYHRQKRERQAGRPKASHCECCGRKDIGTRQTRLEWDHNHATGKFRGWICHRCNMVLGQLRDDARVARCLARYIERTAAREAADETLPLLIGVIETDRKASDTKAA